MSFQRLTIWSDTKSYEKLIGNETRTMSVRLKEQKKKKEEAKTGDKEKGRGKKRRSAHEEGIRSRIDGVLHRVPLHADYYPAIIRGCYCYLDHCATHCPVIQPLFIITGSIGVIRDISMLRKRRAYCSK